MLLMGRHLVGRVLWLIVVGADWGVEKVFVCCERNGEGVKQVLNLLRRSIDRDFTMESA